MADSFQSFASHIKNVCGVQVAVRCTSDVEKICHKNYLTFCEILRPFSQLAAEIQVQDTNGHLYPIRDIRIRFTEPCTEATSSSMVERLLSDTIHWSERGGMASKPSGPTIKMEDGLEIPARTPWFDHYRECYHDNVKIMEHEYFRHYMAVVLVSTSKQSNVIEAFQNLYQLQKTAEQQSSYPYWLPSPHLYYYHVLLHDVSDGNNLHAKESFDRLKSTYGSGNCHLLYINSHDPSSTQSTLPEPWSGFLRIPPSPNTRGQEETDYSFKRFRVKKAKNPHQVKPPDDVPVGNENHHQAHHAITSNSDEVISRGEIKVMLEKGNDDDDIGASNSSTSLQSSEIELGEAPLGEGGGADNVGVVSDRAVRVGECLDVTDQNNLRNFVRELAIRLFPHLSAVLKKLNEQLQSKRTVSRRMSSFSRGLMWKMMGGGSNTSSSSGTFPTSNVTAKLSDDVQLGPDSIERLMRLVGDVALLLQNYELAYNLHHTLKRDLQGKEFWLHYAGALEMAALSAQLMGQNRKEVQTYLEEASQLYGKTLSLPGHALRATLFLCDILKERKKLRDLSLQFVKMISEEADLHSALYLEQAGHAFLRLSPPMLRKYAFHLILSGHHFSRAGQKYHSIRVYKQSLAVYESKGWTIAEDYVHFTCGRLYFSLHSPAKAHKELESLISHDSYQNLQQQMSNLRDYIHVKRTLLSDSFNHISLAPPQSSSPCNLNLISIPLLPLPSVFSHLTLTIFDNGVINPSPSLPTTDNRLLSAGNRDGMVSVGDSSYNPMRWIRNESHWQSLEDSCAGFNKGLCLYMDKWSDNTKIPLCPVNEVVKVGMVLQNTLQVPVLLRNVSLVCDFELPDDQQNVTDNDIKPVECQVLESFTLSSRKDGKMFLSLWIKPLMIGAITVTGIIANLCVKEDVTDSPQNLLSSEGFQGFIELECRGKRLNNTKAERLGVIYGPDNRLQWKIVDSLPRVIMNIGCFSEPLLDGEMVRLPVEIVNCSDMPVTSVRLKSSLHSLLVQKNVSLFPVQSEDGVHYSTFSLSTPLPHYLSITNDVISPGQSYHSHILLHIPQSNADKDGVDSDVVLYYEPSQPTNDIGYRVLRHSEKIDVRSLLKTNVTVGSAVSTDESLDSVKLMISIEVENVTSDLNVTINQITLFSYSWKLKTLNHKDKGLTLASGEVGVVHLTATRELKISPNQLLLSDVVLEGGGMMSPSDQYPINDFILLSQGHRHLLSHPANHETRLGFILHWKVMSSDGISRNGHNMIGHLLPAITPILTVPTSSDASCNITSPSPYDLVRHSLQYPSYVRHDFDNGGLCCVPVVILVENTVSQPVSVCMELLSHQEVAIGTRSMEPSFMWSGQSKSNFVLPSLSRKSIKVFATFLSPGVYCLNFIRVKALLGNGDHNNRDHNGISYQSQRWQVTSNITIYSSNKAGTNNL